MKISELIAELVKVASELGNAECVLRIASWNSGESESFLRDIIVEKLPESSCCFISASQHEDE